MRYEHFNKLKVPQLTKFLHVRFYDTGIIPRGQSNKIPGTNKKGIVIDAVNGVQNLIRVAKDSSDMPPILPRPETDDRGDLLMIPEETGTFRHF